MKNYIDCSIHGIIKWEGDIFCDVCGAPYAMADYSGLGTGAACPNCGSRLTCDPGDEGLEFTGTAECPLCHAGRVLVWKNKDMVKTRVIDCGDHGDKIPWEGHLVCDNCRTVYSADGAQETMLHNGGRCACGSKLLPDADDKIDDFSGRPICPKCFNDRTFAKRG